MDQSLPVRLLLRAQRWEKRSTGLRADRVLTTWPDEGKVLNQGYVESSWHLPNVAGVVQEAVTRFQAQRFHLGW
jgi:hypothetical protein